MSSLVQTHPPQAPGPLDGMARNVGETRRSFQSMLALSQRVWVHDQVKVFFSQHPYDALKRMSEKERKKVRGEEKRKQ